MFASVWRHDGSGVCGTMWMITTPIDATFDYIVVGAGSAGCVVAEALSRQGVHSVAVVEAGGSDAVPAVRIPGLVIRALGNRNLDWGYSTQPDPTRGGRIETWHRGKVLGGSGSINGCFFVRGRPSDFDLWASLGNPGWAAADVIPHFRALERYAGGGDPTVRGQTGPFSVSDIRTPHPLARRFLAAAAERGIPTVADYNGHDAAGAALAQTSVRDGWRETAYRAFLAPARGRGNVTVYPRTVVRRLRLENRRATGVEIAEGGAERVLGVRREVILSAGSIGSPQLLLLSGIGPARQLHSHGIAVQLDLPGVGENLQEHCGVWIVQGLQPGLRTLNMDWGVTGMFRHGLRYMLHRDGPAATPTAHALAFARTTPDLADPDLQIHFMPLGYRITGAGVEVLKTPAIMAVPNVNRPMSRGRVRLASADPRIPPLIEPRLLDSDDDVRRLTAGCRLVRGIFSAPAFASVIAAESFPGPDVESDAQWETFLRAHAGPVFHVAGTCKMGSDPMAVVDPRLRVRGIEGLRVIDASVMPVITSGNTNASTMMIGARGAEFVLQDAAARP